MPLSKALQFYILYTYYIHISCSVCGGGKSSNKRSHDLLDGEYTSCMLDLHLLSKCWITSQSLGFRLVIHSVLGILFKVFRIFFHSARITDIVVVSQIKCICKMTTVCCLHCAVTVMYVLSFTWCWSSVWTPTALSHSNIGSHSSDFRFLNRKVYLFLTRLYMVKPLNMFLCSWIHVGR